MSARGSTESACVTFHRKHLHSVSVYLAYCLRVPSHWKQPQLAMSMPQGSTAPGRCQRCARGMFTWGSGAVDPGQHGWCWICCWCWKHRYPKICLEGGILRKPPLPDEHAQWSVMTFVCGDRLLRAWHSGEAKRDLEQVYIHGRRRIWFRYLLGGSMICTSEVTGEEFSPDTEDEEESGVCSPYLNFQNPLWKLQLCASEQNDPFIILCDMLGVPP